MLGVTIDSKMTLRIIFTRFPEQLLRGLVSCGSPSEYFMIGCSSEDAFEVWSCPFRRTVLQCGANAADTHLKLLDRVVNGASLLTGHCDLAHRRSTAVICMLYKIRYNPRHPLCSEVLYMCRMCQCRLHVVHWSHLGASSLQNLEVLQDFPFHYLIEMILLTLCSMVWD